MRGTVKPLGPRKEANADAGTFHAETVRVHGRLCWFYGIDRVLTEPGATTTRARKPHERCEGKSARVIEAMHIVDRGMLGPKTRYAIPIINGRPGCKTCHRLQTGKLLRFADGEHNAAVRALMKLSPRIAGDLQKLLRHPREAHDGARQRAVSPSLKTSGAIT